MSTSNANIISQLGRVDDFTNNQSLYLSNNINYGQNSGINNRNIPSSIMPVSMASTLINTTTATSQSGSPAILNRSMNYQPSQQSNFQSVSQLTANSATSNNSNTFESLLIPNNFNSLQQKAKTSPSIASRNSMENQLGSKDSRTSLPGKNSKNVSKINSPRAPQGQLNGNSNLNFGNSTVVNTQLNSGSPFQKQSNMGPNNNTNTSGYSSPNVLLNTMSNINATVNNMNRSSISETSSLPVFTPTTQGLGSSNNSRMNINTKTSGMDSFNSSNINGNKINPNKSIPSAPILSQLSASSLVSNTSQNQSSFSDSGVKQHITYIPPVNAESAASDISRIGLYNNASPQIQMKSSILDSPINSTGNSNKRNSISSNSSVGDNSGVPNKIPKLATLAKNKESLFSLSPASTNDIERRESLKSETSIINKGKSTLLSSWREKKELKGQKFMEYLRDSIVNEESKSSTSTTEKETVATTEIINKLLKNNQEILSALFNQQKKRDLAKRIILKKTDEIEKDEPVILEISDDEKMLNLYEQMRKNLGFIIMILDKIEGNNDKVVVKADLPQLSPPE